MFPISYNIIINECFILFRGAEARAHACLGLVYELMKDTDRAIDHHQKVYYVVYYKVIKLLTSLTPLVLP